MKPIFEYIKELYLKKEYFRMIRLIIIIPIFWTVIILQWISVLFAYISFLIFHLSFEEANELTRDFIKYNTYLN